MSLPSVHRVGITLQRGKDLPLGVFMFPKDFKNFDFKFLTLLILIYLFVPAALSAAVIPPAHRPLIDSAVRYILECRFDDAISITEKAYLSSSGGNDGKDGNLAAIAAVLHTAALGMRDVDFDTVVDAAAFAASYERSIASIDKYEPHAAAANSYTLTLRGFSLAMHSSFHLRRGSYLAAAGTGFDAIKIMKEAGRLDSTNTEVNFFLGLYDYTRAELRKRFWWVLFWYPGDKESGIRQLEAGKDGAAITGAACALALSDIYLKEKAPRRSRDIIYNMGRGLPDSRFVMWAEAKYREDQGMYGEAGRVFGRLADSYERERYGAYNAAVTRGKQAQMQSKAGETAEAAKTCTYLIDRYGSSNDKRIAGVVSDVRKLLGKIGQ